MSHAIKIALPLLLSELLPYDFKNNCSAFLSYFPLMKFLTDFMHNINRLPCRIS